MAEPANIAEFKFPAALIGRADLARLVREAENIDAELEQQKVRNSKSEYHLPTMSQAMRDFIEINQIDFTDDQRRMVLIEQLRALKDKAPVVHMTFAVEADPESVGKLVTWLRDNAHPHTLLSIGLQPDLVGGVYLRTPNHIHDFSLRQLLHTSRGVLAADFEELSHG